MLYTATTAVKKILALKKRLKIIQGGSSAGKTIAILLIFIDRAQTEKGKVFSVVSETVPHLKRGAIRDFLSIMEGHNYFKEENWNRTDYIYTFETGSRIEFFSADNADKVRGPRRNVLFINEANNISYETYTQLAIRTSDDIYIDYNPVAEFWVHDEIIPSMTKNWPLEEFFIILTYKDNEALPKAIVEELESRQDRTEWFKVFGMGELGQTDGKIYQNWRIIDEVPPYAKLQGYGLDFGFTNDPAAIVAVYTANGEIILDEVAYQKGLSNKKIADIFLNLEEALVVADSSEPKSIDEIRGYGVNIQGVVKNKGETKSQTFNKWSIDLVQEQKIAITKRSVNGIKEYRNYMWEKDKDGKILNIPAGGFDHFMDAARYRIISLVKKPVVTMAASPPLAPYYGDRDITF